MNTRVLLAQWLTDWTTATRLRHSNQISVLLSSYSASNYAYLGGLYHYTSCAAIAAHDEYLRTLAVGGASQKG